MVMPCSRSASRPSTSSAKSMSSPLVPCAPGIRVQRGELVLEDQLGVVEQPADQRGLAVIDRAAGEEAQQRPSPAALAGRLTVGGRWNGVIAVHQK